MNNSGLALIANEAQGVLLIFHSGSHDGKGEKVFKENAKIVKGVNGSVAYG